MQISFDGLFANNLQKFPCKTCAIRFLHSLTLPLIFLVRFLIFLIRFLFFQKLLNWSVSSYFWTVSAIFTKTLKISFKFLCFCNILHSSNQHFVTIRSRSGIRDIPPPRPPHPSPPPPLPPHLCGFQGKYGCKAET